LTLPWDRRVSSWCLIASTYKRKLLKDAVSTERKRGAAMNILQSRYWHRVLIFCSFLSVLCFSNYAEASLQWQNVRPTVATKGIATNGSIYVSAAANGIFTSVDLANWARISLPSNAGQSYNDIIWSSADSLFVAVGLGTILTSPDGSNWTIRYQDTSDLGVVLKSVIYANGTYVAVGSDTQGAIAITSADSMSWQMSAIASNPANTSLSITGIAWGNAQYVAFGSSIGDPTIINPDGGPFSDILYTSTDAVTWTAQSLPQGGDLELDGGVGNDAAFSGGVFTVGGATGVYTSTDGINWTESSLTPSNDNALWYFSRIQTIGSDFYAVGADIGDPNYSGGKELAVFSSSDGINWGMTALNQMAGASFVTSVDAIASGGPGYIVAGESGAWTSDDANTWTSYISTTLPVIATCAYADHGVVAVTGDDYSVVSSDGIHWSAATYMGLGGELTLGGEGCMAANGKLFLAATGFGDPIISTDGLSWSYVNDSIVGLYTIQGVAYNGTQFYLIGIDSSGHPIESASSDGSTWNAISPTGLPSDPFFGEPGFVAGLTAGGGKLIAWGAHVNTGQPFLVVSANGVQWTSVSALPAALTSIAAVAYGDGTYIGIGSDASGNTLMISSSDAASWTQISNLPAGLQGISWNNISYGGSTWLITGVGGSDPGMLESLTSTDGKSWSLQSLGIGETGTAFNGTWDGNGFVAASFYDIVEAPVSTGGSGGSGGGGSGGGGGGSGGGGSSSSGGGGGTLGIFALFIFALCGIFRTQARNINIQKPD
jgi:hypothetical protein